MSSSWFPFSLNFSLPSLTPPLSIQRRFISFVLKRSLGHLLKPGQLDIDQIDAQIGSGFVEVKDLELDCNAINSLLDDQPVQLQAGTLAAVTARIPWPNPFSSTVGLSLSGLRLELCVSEPRLSPRDDVHSDELADSVASVAESFIHEELTQREEAQLRQSIHPNQDGADDIPGSLDPFLSQGQETQHTSVNDPEGVGIFATLFESLLARFDFDAVDLQISLINPDGITVTLGVSRIRYFTEGSKSGQSSESNKASVGETRSLEIQGVRLTIKEPIPSSPTHARDRSSPASSTTVQEGSDSELDDETQMMMTQSLVSLPPQTNDRSARSSSPSLSTISSASAASSMYQSAISASKIPSRPQSPRSSPEVPFQKTVTEKIILEVSEPILVQLTTPPVTHEVVDDSHGASISDGKGKGKEHPSEMLMLNVSIGVVALLLDAHNVCGILSLFNALSSASRQSVIPPRRETRPSSSDNFMGSALEKLDFSLNLKGLVLITLGDSIDEPREISAITQFYERPLVPPYLPCGYVRLHVEKLKAVMNHGDSINNRGTFSSGHQSPLSSSSFQATSSRRTFASCAVSDISILAFHPSASPSGGARTADNHNSSSPILVTDLNLSNSYQSTSSLPESQTLGHKHPFSDEEKQTLLPIINLINWSSDRTMGQGSSLRPWRTKASAAPHHRKVSSGLGAGFVSNIGLSTSPTRTMRSPLSANATSPAHRGTPAIYAKLLLGGSAGDTSISIETAPIHVFINLEAAHSVTNFVETALSNTYGTVSTEPSSPNSSWSQDTIEDKIDRPLSSRTVGEERRRLEKLVLDDLDLGMDYRQSGDITPRRQASPRRTKTKRHRQSVHPSPHVDVSVPLLRVEVCVPPPRNRQPRSGSLVLDIHSAHFSSSAQHLRTAHRVPRFETNSEIDVGLEEWFNGVGASQPASLEMQRVVIAYAGLGQIKAETVLSLGPISGIEAEGARYDENSLPPLVPLVLFRNSASQDLAAPQTKSIAILARVPSLHIVVNKACLDGLQLWTDDISQWADRISSGRASGSSTHAQVSRTTSMIGSRYFVQRAGSGVTESDIAGTATSGLPKSELVLKASLSEAYIRLLIPSSEGETLNNNRFLEMCAKDLDALIEVKPEGKDETVVTLNILDASVAESSSKGSHSIVSSRTLSINKTNQAVLKLRFRSVSVPGTVAKESRVKIILNGLIVNMWSDVVWISDLVSFVKAPPGAFESVIPSERTQISINTRECAFRMTPPSRPSALVLSLGDVTVSTDLVGESQETALNTSVSDLSILLNDDVRTLQNNAGMGVETDAEYWMGEGYAILATIQGLTLNLNHNAKLTPANTQIIVNGMLLNLHLCADSISGIAGFAADMQSMIPSSPDADFGPQSKLPRRPTDVSQPHSSTLLRSLDEQAFRRQPDIGPLPDMISDDLPKNLDYLDASFGAAGGFRPLDEEDDEDEFFPESTGAAQHSEENITSRHGGETIKMLSSPIEIIENFYETLTPSSLDFASEHGETSIKVRAQDCDVHLLLYDGYDWDRTRRAIQEEVKRVRRRLAKIRQLLANGQTYDPNIDEVNSTLFNSVYVGLEQDADGLEGDALMAAIDEELATGDDATELASESSWQSFKPNNKPKAERRASTLSTSRLNRARGPSIEFSLRGMAVDFDQYLPGAKLASRLLSTVKDLEILDHIKTSTWSTFLTELRADSRGNIRETDSNMVRVELQMLLPFQGHLEQEARLKAKLLPLRLHVDQDALDFLKKFFSFKDADAAPSPPPESEIFFQHVEIFPVDIKLDYKPRRVDYRALKEGKTIELMNFFHFDGAEMTLRHLTLKGITGWPRMFDTLNDLWTPDVKANQLIDVISGVSPIRSAVNVGSGVADLVLLPIAQYKKDGRIIRGLQKGTTAFVKSTAMEAIRLGARLATGTQVVLEQTENVLGGQFSGPVTAEAFQLPAGSGDFADTFSDEEGSPEDLISRYAEQPSNVSEGVHAAVRTLSQNFKSAGQTILAVPMEVYERSGKEGPARAVIRAVPIAVLKPMIGASEAISKALLGLNNTLDPQAQIDTETKYKHR